MPHPHIRPAALALLLAAPLVATALALPRPALAETLLRLSQEARVMVHPDTLSAALALTADAPTAAEAQARVNAAATRVLAEAGKVAHVVAATGAYNVWQTTRPADRWHASQSVQLHASDGPALLALVGRLQGEGAALQNLTWQLSPEARRKAEHEATAEALKALRARASEAAGLLDLRFVEFREVRLDAAAPSPHPLPALMTMAAEARAAPPPAAQGEDITVSATVGADAVLAPKQP